MCCLRVRSFWSDATIHADLATTTTTMTTVVRLSWLLLVFEQTLNIRMLS